MKLFFAIISLFYVVTAQADLVNDKHGVALDGYDVVAYFNNSKAGLNKGTKGVKEISSSHHGHKYYFQSKENKTIFDKSPESYLPRYGGWCAWAVVSGDINVPVNYNTFLVSADSQGVERLYLFYNKWGINTLKKWQKGDSAELVRKADIVWSKKAILAK